MKKLSVSIAIALAVGVCAATSAQAGCDPAHDPGSPCPGGWKYEDQVPGAHALLYGHYVETHAKLRKTSWVKDTADDGLDAHVWVRYLAYERGERVTMKIATASGLGATTSIEWVSPDAVDFFQTRVCAGPDETRCADWG